MCISARGLELACQPLETSAALGSSAGSSCSSSTAFELARPELHILMSTMQQLAGGGGRLAPSLPRTQPIVPALSAIRQHAGTSVFVNAALQRSRRSIVAAAAGRGGGANPGGSSSGSGSSSGGGFEPHGVPHRHVEYMLNAVSHGAAEQAGAEYGEVSPPRWAASVPASTSLARLCLQQPMASSVHVRRLAHGLRVPHYLTFVVNIWAAGMPVGAQGITRLWAA